MAMKNVHGNSPQPNLVLYPNTSNVDTNTRDTSDAEKELLSNFEEMRAELDKKQQEMMNMLNSPNQSNSNLAREIVWHRTNFTQAVENVCELELACENGFLTKSHLWEKCDNGSGRNELRGATSLSYDPVELKLYVADRENQRISIFGKDGQTIRVRPLNDLHSKTPIPELLILDSCNQIIWLYASDSCVNPVNFHFIAFDAADLSEKFHVKGIPRVITLSLSPENHLHYFSYDVTDHHIEHGYVDINKNVAPCTTLYLESGYLENCRKVLGLQTLDNYVFIIYRDIDFRILKFDMKFGKFCECYLSKDIFEPLECFYLLSQKCFLLARIGSAPLKQESQQNLFTPVRKGLPYLQLCIVSPEGNIKNQLAIPITPVSEDFEVTPVRYKCSQVLVSDGRIFVLLRGCTQNLMAF